MSEVTADGGHASSTASFFAGSGEFLRVFSRADPQRRIDKKSEEGEGVMSTCLGDGDTLIGRYNLTQGTVTVGNTTTAKGAITVTKILKTSIKCE